MMPTAAALSGAPGKPARGSELLEKVGNCSSCIHAPTTIPTKKRIMWESEAGWSAGHSLCGATSDMNASR